MSHFNYCSCGYGWDNSITSGDHTCTNDPFTTITWCSKHGDYRYKELDPKECPICKEEQMEKVLPGDDKILYGVKYDIEKPRMELLPMDALLMIAKVLTFGAKKYGDRNWEKGIDPQRFRAAILRHDAAVEMGEELDPESRLLHVAHKACSALMELALKLREKND